MKTFLILLTLFLPTHSDTLPKVYVEWIDIVSTDGGWHTVEELDGWISTEPDTVHQIGFLFRETKEYIVLVDSYFSNDLKGYAVKIPKGCVIKIVKLTP